ncbi:DNA repair protein RecO [Ruminococcaceae bacterium OttesenSCG-928-O06]|nr:DNA repair protein RecO [Ruminococcaceae bacterium OttesenSCG-928-O06]
MKITEKGLVLKEVKLRESDRILTLFTPRHGIISASARGSLRPGNKLFSASGLFCYSEWVLHEGKTMYSVDEAAPIEVFYGLREDIEALALAAYIAELLQIFSPTGQEAQTLLRLALNCFYALSRAIHPPTLVKPAFEMRSLSETGFLPDLLACEECGTYEGGDFYFDVRGGTLLCGNCLAERGLVPNLSPAALAALRHIVLADAEKLFSFQLGQENAALLGAVSEQYLLAHLDWPPKTLAFLKTLMAPAPNAPEGLRKTNEEINGQKIPE